MGEMKLIESKELLRTSIFRVTKDRAIDRKGSRSSAQSFSTRARR